MIISHVLHAGVHAVTGRIHNVTPRYLYSIEEIENTYANVRHHISTKEIILRHSTNTSDIRWVAIDGLDLSETKHVLDLGCGYGFFIEALEGRLHNDALITGIDIIDNSNREIFLFTADSMGYGGEFIHGSADIINSMDENIFDMVISSYSLYFFPHLIPAIARILVPGGVFISLTHSRHTLKEVVQMIPLCLLDAGIEPPETISIKQLFSEFCRENGESLLEPYFENIETIEFINSLLFRDIQIDDCIYYLDKKKNLLFKEVFTNYVDMAPLVMDNFYYRLINEVSTERILRLTKDDAIFRAFHSVKRGGEQA